MPPAGSREMHALCRHSQGRVGGCFCGCFRDPKNFLCSFSAAPSGPPPLPWRSPAWLPVPGNEGRPLGRVASEGPGRTVSSPFSPRPPSVSRAHPPSLPARLCVGGLRLLPFHGGHRAAARSGHAHVCGGLRTCVRELRVPGTQQQLPSAGAVRVHPPTVSGRPAAPRPHQCFPFSFFSFSVRFRSRHPSGRAAAAHGGCDGRLPGDSGLGHSLMGFLVASVPSLVACLSTPFSVRLLWERSVYQSQSPSTSHVDDRASRDLRPLSAPLLMCSCYFFSCPVRWLGPRPGRDWERLERPALPLPTSGGRCSSLSPVLLAGFSPQTWMRGWGLFLDSRSWAAPSCGGCGLSSKVRSASVGVTMSFLQPLRVVGCLELISNIKWACRSCSVFPFAHVARRVCQGFVEAF